MKYKELSHIYPNDEIKQNNNQQEIPLIKSNQTNPNYIFYPILYDHNTRHSVNLDSRVYHYNLKPYVGEKLPLWVDKKDKNGSTFKANVYFVLLFYKTSIAIVHIFMIYKCIVPVHLVYPHGFH